ncbi:MAG: S-layer homology domain-containing protein [Oscillospiraceae bacterium]|nr:S-layer homology domain-containing protein [Oscillospiraceae bacterium]
MELSRNKLKKILALTLAIALLLGTGMTAVADEPVDDPGNETLAEESLVDITEYIDDDESITPMMTTASLETASLSPISVADSSQLTAALASIAGSGGVINVTASFTHTSRIVIDGVSIELNLGSNTLTIEPPSPLPPITSPNPSLSIVNNAALTVTGPGTLNVFANPFNAINVNGSILTNNGAVINAARGWDSLIVTNGTATGINVSGRIHASTGAIVTVNGDVTGIVAVGEGNTVTVNDNVNGWVSASGEGTVVTVNGTLNGTTTCSNGATATINGNSNGTVSAWGGTITVNGNITGNFSYGIRVHSDGAVTVNGNIILTEPHSIGVGFIASGDDGNNNNVTVNGVISAATYIQIIFYEDDGNYSVPRITVLNANRFNAIVERGGRSYRQFVTRGGNLYVLAGVVLPEGWNQPESTNRFRDVPNNNWQNDAVSWADRNGITTGSPANSNTFKPDDRITRAEFVTFLHRIYGTPDATNATFDDMPGNEAFQNAISWAFEKGITTGSPANSDTFMPNRHITREEIATMLHRYIGGGTPAPIDVLGGYTDRNTISTWAGARDAVNWAVYNGIMGVNVNTLNPRGNATRAEAVTMLYRVVGTFKIPSP